MPSSGSDDDWRPELLDEHLGDLRAHHDRSRAILVTVGRIAKPVAGPAGGRSGGQFLVSRAPIARFHDFAHNFQQWHDCCLHESLDWMR